MSVCVGYSERSKSLKCFERLDIEERGQLSLLFALIILRFPLLVATLGLYVLVVDSECFIDLGTEGRLILDAVKLLEVVDNKPNVGNLQVDQLRVIHLQKHASDLAS